MGARAQVIDGYLEPAGFLAVADLSAAAELTVPPDAKLALIQAEGEDVRWRDDGTDPTDSAGMLLEAGQTLVYNGNLQAIRLIEATASATLNVSFYK
jgi:hypothetical protein